MSNISVSTSGYYLFTNTFKSLTCLLKTIVDQLMPLIIPIATIRPNSAAQELVALIFLDVSPAFYVINYTMLLKYFQLPIVI